MTLGQGTWANAQDPPGGGGGPRAAPNPGRAALISGRRGPAASPADSDAGAGGVATERRSRAPRAADAPRRRGAIVPA